MSKKNLYSIIAILCAIILYLLFMPTQAPVVEAPVMVPIVATTTDDTVDTEAPPTDEASPEAEDSVTIEGLFLSLAEAENEFQQDFFYLMLDDGTEVVRIDLRPLLGYSLIDPVGKLGVDRGQQVRVSGSMVDGKFVIAAIDPVAN